MKKVFKDYLFNKHYFVNDSGEKSEQAFETLFALANLFDIKITSGQSLAEEAMLHLAEEQIGYHVPEAFYRGFPQSVRALSKDALLFDQLVHYTVTYGFGNFSEAGHSLLEEQFERIAFDEDCEIKEFAILTEQEAVDKMEEYVADLLKSTRPLDEEQYQLVKGFIDEYSCSINYCENKDTAIRMLLESGNMIYARFISLADIIKVVERIYHEQYGADNIKKLNLKNKDRKFITALINAKFTDEEYILYPYSNAVRECYEKQAIWSGLLHHIHYKPVNELAAQFVDGIRNGKNISAFSGFEKAMAKKDIQSAVHALLKGKGSGALLRKLNYILSRCETEEEIAFVMEHMETKNPIILIQMLLQYAAYSADSARDFVFTRYNKLVVHKETKEEMEKRQSVISENVRKMMAEVIHKNLHKIYKGQLGKVYVDPAMKKIAVPLKAAASMAGFGAFPTGSRIHIPVEKGKKIRAFTYWEKVDDIDLSVFGVTDDGRQQEFSWRSMFGRQSEGITFSGDQTSGYNGGSEFFDLDPVQFRKEYPDVKYLVFCNNVFSKSRSYETGLFFDWGAIPFSECECRAGYMVRDVKDSGQIWEPKTVQSSFKVDCDSSFVYLFGIDLEENDIVCLNMVRESDEAVAGTTSLSFLADYFHLAKVFNVADLFSMLATEVTEVIEEADVIVTDEAVTGKEGAEIIRSSDTEKIIAYMNSYK